MNSSRLASFLFTWIQETIDYKQYIEEVSISYEYVEIYGNESIRVSYMIERNESWDNLPFNDRQALFNRTPDHSFTLSTNKKIRYNKKEKMLRILEFKYIYESLAAYAVLQFEKYLNEGTAIKVRGIDLWPEANYAEKYFLSDSHDRYSDVMCSYFESDTSQWSRLHQLAKESKKVYTREKTQFTTTDTEINELFQLKFNDIHYILLHYKIPIRLKGIKTVDEVRIHTARLVEALKQEINREYVSQRGAYKGLIIYLYDRYLTSEKAKIIQHQQSEFLKHFIIQKGDILQLKDMRIVMANAISFDQEGKINIEYMILKNNLQPGERTRIIGTEAILYVLKEQLFLEFVDQIPVKHLSLLDRWMSKRKMELNFKPFKPDLIREIKEANELNTLNSLSLN